MSGDFQRTTRHYIPEYGTLHSYGICLPAPCIEKSAHASDCPQNCPVYGIMKKIKMEPFCALNFKEKFWMIQNVLSFPSPKNESLTERADVWHQLHQVQSR
jgi:hypothetical protein